MAGNLSIDCSVRFPGGIEVRPRADFGAFGQVTALYGPSAGGKTTILRILAGLLRPSFGTVALGNQVWNDTERGIFMPPQKRKIGLVFQDYALFPHLSVLSNILYAAKGPKMDIQQRAQKLMQSLDIDGLAQRKPGQLSGGQRQRVALARAVVRRPSWLLLDEPMASLDENTKRQVRGELGRFLRESGIPSLFVTHHPEDLEVLADALAVIDEGRVVQHGPRAEVLDHPANARVARILGYENVFTDLALLPPPVRVFAERHAPAETRGVAFRAIALRIPAAHTPVGMGEIRLPVTRVAVEPSGSLCRLSLSCGHTPLTAYTLGNMPDAPHAVILREEDVRWLK